MWNDGIIGSGGGFSNRFLDALKGIVDPELKRKAIGKVFIEVFDDEAQ